VTALPNALALPSAPADGALAVASDLRNDFAAIQVAVNGLIAALSGGVAGQPLVSGGASAVSFAAPLITTYRKTTAKTVNTTVAATDLLNGEITIAGGVMGTAGTLRLTAWGDFLQNAAGALPRFQLVFGGTTFLDTGAPGTIAAGSSRTGWRIVAEIINLGVANSQIANLSVVVTHMGGTSAFPSTLFATGNGVYTGIGLAGSPTNCTMSVAEGTNAATVDTSVAKALVLNVINGSASATYETKLLGALVEII
jgi:hypothetical protein